MKHLSFSFTMVLALSTYSLGQVQKTKPVRKTKQIPPQTQRAVEWKPVIIEKWGVKGLSLPVEFVQVKESVEPGHNEDVNFTGYSRFWRKPFKDKDDLRFDVNLFVTTWNQDFTKVPGLKADAATPENLVMTDHLANLKSKTSDVVPVEEAILLKLNGVRGSFSRFQLPGNEKVVRVIWSTYRYFQNKAQRIFVSITAPRTELPKIMKILESLKLQES